MNQEKLLKVIDQAAKDGRTELDLEGNKLTSLPAEFGQLKNLIILVLYNNNLTSLPAEFWQLKNLTELNLGGNNLSSVPAEIAQLKNLTELYLHDNKLTSVPTEIGQLEKLTTLTLGENNLTSMPAEIAQLKNLTRLTLHNNNLSSVSAEICQLKNLKNLSLDENNLTSMPAEMGQLKNLTGLSLNGNNLISLPAEISQLKNLTDLSLDDNNLTSLPTEIVQLKNLTDLSLDDNNLTSLPTEIVQLKNLKTLVLHNNNLTSLPAEIVQLKNLKTLVLHNNNLTSLPAEIVQLKNLTRLDLNNNNLTSLPAEIGQLKNLTELSLAGNPIKEPPPEIVKQGTKAVLAYLQELEKSKTPQWVSKLIVVGEGGVGKTSLLRVLQDEDFILGFETTHGIDIKPLELSRPDEAGVNMTLNCWDFGGQTIYHATHQFFMSRRSLYILVWDARHGWEAGKLYYWLDTIKARAPKSPVMIVAAHIDERYPDIPGADLKKKYPQIVDFYQVSNKERTGIKDLRDAIAKVAVDEKLMPLMGKMWPSKWLNAANAIRMLKDRYIKPAKLDSIFNKHGVDKEARKVLAQLLHDLGVIIYFAEDNQLNDMVILDAQWVTEEISKVLESREVIKRDGIFTRTHMKKLWGDVESEHVRQHLLRLMEQFDLSYRTLENKEISLVVERLPLDPPEGYKKEWDEKKQNDTCKEVSMKFELSSLQAGLPTWFIARSHRFTTHTHWRNGAVFADSNQKEHLALVEAFEYERYLQLTTRGIMPANFFALLRDGMELTLERFAGLNITRTIPCPGHKGQTCSHEFDLRQVENAFMKNIANLQCPESLEDVSVAKLLYGVITRIGDEDISKAIDELRKGQERILDSQTYKFEKLQDDHERIITTQEKILVAVEKVTMLQRAFTNVFDNIQRFDDKKCPNVFAVLPVGAENWVKKNIAGQKMGLQLYCQKPGHWHPTYHGGYYKIPKPGEWLSKMGTYLDGLASIMSKTVSLITPAAGVAGAVVGGPVGVALATIASETFKHHVKLMEELAKKLSSGKDISTGELLDDIGRSGKVIEADGAPLRALRKLLDEVDPKHHWGGLSRIYTPEGHYLWLCEDHAKEYKI